MDIINALREMYETYEIEYYSGAIVIAVWLSITAIVSHVVARRGRNAANKLIDHQFNTIGIHMDNIDPLIDLLNNKTVDLLKMITELRKETAELRTFICETHSEHNETRAQLGETRAQMGKTREQVDGMIAEIREIVTSIERIKSSNFIAEILTSRLSITIEEMSETIDLRDNETTSAINKLRVKINDVCDKLIDIESSDSVPTLVDDDRSLTDSDDEDAPIVNEIAID